MGERGVRGRGKRKGERGEGGERKRKKGRVTKKNLGKEDKGSLSKKYLFFNLIYY